MQWINQDWESWKYVEKLLFAEHLLLFPLETKTLPTISEMHFIIFNMSRKLYMKPDILMRNNHEQRTVEWNIMKYRGTIYNLMTTDGIGRKGAPSPVIIATFLFRAQNVRYSIGYIELCDEASRFGLRASAVSWRSSANEHACMQEAAFYTRLRSVGSNFAVTDWIIQLKNPANWRRTVSSYMFPSLCIRRLPLLRKRFVCRIRVYVDDMYSTPGFFLNILKNIL